MIATIKSVAMIGGGLAIVAYLIWSNWVEIVEQLRGRSINWGYLVGGFAVCLSATVLTFLRWYLLVWAQDLPFRLSDSLRIGFIGYAFNLLIPGAVGGDLVKAVLLVREQERRTVALATLLIDRIVGLYGMILLAGLVTALYWIDIQSSSELRQVALFAGGLVATSTAGMLLLFSRRIHGSGLMAWVARLPVVGDPFGEAVAAMASYRSRWRVVALAVAMSIVGHVGFVCTLRLAMSGLCDTLPPGRVHFMLAPFGLMIGAIPITPGGLGLAEGAMEKLFEFAGENGALTIVMMLAYRGMQVAIALVGVIYYLTQRSEIRPAMAEASAAAGPGIVQPGWQGRSLRRP